MVPITIVHKGCNEILMLETVVLGVVKRVGSGARLPDSKSPLESLLVAGIDMTDPEVVNGAIEDFASCVKQFSELYGK